ncbi:MULTISPECIES: NfrA family protein [Ramlibacter]|uniref:Bacteriophage N4 adsorption protein A C-terminal domain-containing protein n=1 Tax=Ramlibacter pinisoli TaxID=2682844 RepID=A0A6N8IYJ0_9BURK|nr:MULTISPECIES: hypothetical protein [Ramlibacter]MBA2962146.1 hypothetical protein [Ramlibacter sp. CGMCC 1.13660]MVQ32089.1 hypothetical protein [Ramlibacter pinisoli]
MRGPLRMLGLLAALGGAAAPVHANWLASELRAYRSFPRLNEALRLYDLRQYDKAREYIDQVERIDPGSRQAAVVKFNICEKQKDHACIRELSQAWQARAPGDGLGTALATYLAYVDGRDADLAQLAPEALRGSGLTAAVRRTLGQEWVRALLRLDRFDDARAAIEWLDANKVTIGDRDRSAWQQAIAAGTSAPVARGMPTGPSVPPAQVVPGAPAPSQPAARAQPPVRGAPGARAAQSVAPAVPTPPPAPPPRPSAESEVLPLIEAGRHSDAVARIQQLQSEGRLTAQEREAFVLTLQGRDCAGVLRLVPPDASSPLTTARQQLAAAYCSGQASARAGRHFAAAQALAGGDAALAAQALTGKANALALQGDAAGARAALAEAVRMAPNDAQARAAHGYQLKSAGADEEALREFEAAWQLDGARTELLPEMALLAQHLNRREDSIRYGRAAIDESDGIRRRQPLSEDEARRRLFGWRREVQTQEDRFNWIANANVRLDHGPDINQPLSPVDYAQYAGSLNLGGSYRYTPLGAQLPTWAFARAATGLQDRSLAFEPENKLLGLGVRQRLSRDYLAVASAEYLWRKSAAYPDDVMLRLSGSHTWNGDWNPADRQWNFANVYADFAWLVRAETYYATLSGELGRHYKLPDVPFDASVMPYLLGSYTSSNDSIGRAAVDRLDVGLGLAFQSWHWEDKHRAPALSHRLSLEVRRVVGGNTTDRHAVQLKWILQH